MKAGDRVHIALPSGWVQGIFVKEGLGGTRPYLVWPDERHPVWIRRTLVSVVKRR